MIKFFAVTVPAFHPSLFLYLLLFALLLLRNYFRFSNAILLPAVIPCPFPFAFFSTLSLSFSHDFFFIRDSCACIDCRLPLLPSGARPFSLSFFPLHARSDATRWIPVLYRVRFGRGRQIVQVLSIFKRNPSCGNIPVARAVMVTRTVSHERASEQAIKRERERNRETERAEP